MFLKTSSFSLLLMALLLGCFAEVKAQYWTTMDVEGSNGSGVLDKAWAGGMNNPQFSAIDLNQDGMMDLFAFDRKGDKVMTFVYDASNPTMFTYAPQYEASFPELFSWALIEDFNCDGVGDIFTYRNGGVILYTGTFDGVSLGFTEDTNKLKYDEAGFFRAIEISDFDVPEVVDVDNDGDLDILTFNPSGGFVEFFNNRAAANGDPCGVIDFELTDECWGDFYESGLSTKVSLYSSCKGGRPAERSGGVHAGSTLMTFDEDFDGDLELVLGDLNFANLGRLVNGGDSAVALMTGQDTLFPSYDVPYLQPQFPASFYYDVDHDGRGDMLVAPNSTQLGKGRSNVWYYRDIGTTTVEFNFQTDSFLVGDMFDLGTGASPVFFDHNGDGLLDIVSGNQENNADVSSLALFENIGTSSAPAFQLITLDYMGLSIYSFTSLHPDFGDIDGDGDLDMLVGEEEGKMHLFINNPVSGVAAFGLAAPNYMGLDVGQASTPELIDLDRDGDLDLLAGERNGNLNYFENTGSSTTAMFASTPDNDLMGGIWLTDGALNLGYIAPRVYDHPDSGYVLFVGHDNGKFYYYTGLEDDLTDSFDLQTDFYSELDVGGHGRLDIADLDGDGNPEVIIGNHRGGLTLYTETAPPPPNGISGIDATPFDWYPNPATDLLTIMPPSTTAYDVAIYDLTGRLRLTSIGLRGSQQLDISELETGMYLLEFTQVQAGSVGRSAQKLMVTK